MTAPNQRVPGRARWRKASRWWHRWFGLLVGPWLILLALTGSAIAFYEDLDRWLNPDWRSVPVVETYRALAVNRALDQARERLAGFEARFINLPNSPGDTIAMLGSYEPAKHEHAEIEVFSHPTNGKLLGWREVERFGLDRRHLMNTLYGLHVDMLLGEIGAWIIGFMALLWVIDHVPAVVLAVPRLAKIAGSFRIARSNGRLRLLYDLHRAPGLWLYPVTLLLAVTGLGLAWPEASRDAVRLFSPVSERLHYAMPDAHADRAIGIDEAIAHFAASNIGPIDSVTLLPRNGLYAIRSFDRRDVDDIGRLWTYIDMNDGRVIAQRHDRGDSAGDAVFAWLYPLHSGRAFNVPGKSVVAMAGLATALLAATGIILWLKRRGYSKRSNARSGSYAAQEP